MEIGKIIIEYRRWSGSNYRIERNNPQESVMYDQFKTADDNNDGNITLVEYLTYLKDNRVWLNITYIDLDLANNIENLKNNKSPLTRVAAAGNLGKTGNRAAVPVLIDSMRNETNIEPQYAAVEALGVIRGEDAEIALIEDLIGEHCKIGSGKQAQNEDWRVREKIVNVLGSFREETAVSAVIIAMQEDTVNKVRNVAFLVLKNLQNKLKPDSRLYVMIKNGIRNSKPVDKFLWGIRDPGFDPGMYRR